MVELTAKCAAVWHLSLVVVVSATAQTGSSIAPFWPYITSLHPEARLLGICLYAG
jgi:hypothetical protein